MDLAKIRKKAKAAAVPLERNNHEVPAQEAAKAIEPFAANEEISAAPGTIEPEPPSSGPVASGHLPAEESSLGKPQENTERHLEKLLIFKLGRRRYAIPISDVSQIIDARPATPIPHSPGYLRGIFSLRGRIVMVLDGAARLDLPEEAVQQESAKIVVLDLGEELFGIYTHGIEQVVEVDLGALEPPPESFLPQEQELVEGVFHHRDRTVALLNLPLFLAFDTTGRTA